MSFLFDMFRRSAEEQAAIDAMTNQPSPDAAIAQRMQQGEQFPLMNKATRNLAAGPANAVLSLPALASMLSSVPAGVGAAISPNEGEGRGAAFARGWMNDQLPLEGQERLQALVAQKTAEYQAANPDATAEQVRLFQEQFTKSDDFYRARLNEQGPLMRASQLGQWAVNDAFGVENARPDQQDATDSAYQILSGSVLGVGGAPARAIQQVINKLPTGARIAARTAEALTPATVPLTPGNVALNAGAGLVVDTAGRELLGEQSLLDAPAGSVPDMIADPAQQLAPPMPVPRPDLENTKEVGLINTEEAATLGAVLGMAFMGKFAPRFGAKVADDIAKGVDPVAAPRNLADGIPAGPTQAEQAGDLKPVLGEAASTFGNVVDQTAPAVQVARKLGATDEMLQDIDFEMNTATMVGKQVSIDDAMYRGKLDGVEDIPPYVQFVEANRKLPNAVQTQLDTYLHALQRRQDTNIQRAQFQAEVDKAAEAHVDALVGRDRRKIQQAVTQLEEARAQLQRLDSDPEDMRPSLFQWSKADVDRLIAEGDAIPAFKAYADGIRKASQGFAEYRRKHGLIDLSEQLKWERERPMYFPLRSDPTEGMSATQKLWDRAKNSWDGYSEGERSARKAGRDISGESTNRIANPRHHLEALHEMYYNAVSEVAENNARLGLLDRLGSLGGENVAYKRVPQEQIGRTIEVRRNGKAEHYIMADPSLHSALQFSPTATVAGLHELRKLRQQGTTGFFAPWFAMRAYLWDAQAMGTLAPKGRTVSLLGTKLREMSMGTQLEKPLEWLDDYTPNYLQFFTNLAAIPEQVKYNVQDAVAQSVTRDLLGRNTFLDQLAKRSPAWAARIEQTGLNMSKAFDASVYNLYRRNVGAHQFAHDQVLKKTQSFKDELMSRVGQLPVLGTGIKAVAHPLVKTYSAVLDAFHNAGRYSFFKENYALLNAKYKGNIPQEQLNRLYRDTKNLTGDLTRQSGNKNIQRLNSSLMYGNAMLQGTAYTVNAAFHSRHGMKFWTQMFFGVAMPALMIFEAIKDWQGAIDYYNNSLPDYERLRGLPLPTIDTIIHRVTEGEWPAFTPDALTTLELSPDNMLFIEPILIGMRTLGIGVGSRDEYGIGGVGAQAQALGEQAFGLGIGSIPMAELGLNAAGYTSQFGGISEVPQMGGPGFNKDALGPNSVLPQFSMSVAASLMGTAGTMLTQAVDQGLQVQRDTDKFADAALKVLDTAGFEATQRVPRVISANMWGASRKLGSSTPHSEYVYDVSKELDAVTGSGRQISVDRDSRGVFKAMSDAGLPAPPKTTDPVLGTIANHLYSFMNQKGQYKALSDAYTEQRRIEEGLKARRAQDSSQSDWQRTMNEVVLRKQGIRQAQARMLHDTEDAIAAAGVGQSFQQQFGMPFTYKNFMKAYNQHLGRKGWQ